MTVVFKTVAERAFCVGVDLTEFDTTHSPIIARWVGVQDVWEVLSNLKQPLIAGVNDYVSSNEDVLQN